MQLLVDDPIVAETYQITLRSKNVTGDTLPPTEAVTV